MIRMMLLDTNVFIDHLRGYGPAVRFFETLQHSDNVLFSAITETELVAGQACQDPDKKEKLMHFLYRWNKIPVSNPIAVLAGDITRQFGLLVPDAIIAATALFNKAELITKNTKDFHRVPGLKVRAPY